LQGGIGTTFAGTGASGDVDGVRGVAAIGVVRSLSIDSNGFLWVADQTIKKVRMYDTATGLGTTMIPANAGAQIYGVAVDSPSSKVYVSDRSRLNVEAYRASLPAVTASPTAPTMPTATLVYGSGAAALADGTGSVAQFNGVQDGSFDPTTNEVLMTDYLVDLDAVTSRSRASARRSCPSSVRQASLRWRSPNDSG
jgi:hypothetical protein